MSSKVLLYQAKQAETQRNIINDVNTQSNKTKYIHTKFNQ